MILALTALLGRWQGIMLALGAAALASVLIIFGAYRRGEKAAAATATAATAVATMKAMETKRDVEDRIARDGDDDVAKRLRDGWSRD